MDLKISQLPEAKDGTQVVLPYLGSDGVLRKTSAGRIADTRMQFMGNWDPERKSYPVNALVFHNEALWVKDSVGWTTNSEPKEGDPLWNLAVKNVILTE